MAVLIDTSILIAYERGQLDVAARVAGREAEEAFLSVISASELLHGVHRATDPAVRARRLAFVEATLPAFRRWRLTWRWREPTPPCGAISRSAVR